MLIVQIDIICAELIETGIYGFFDISQVSLESLSMCNAEFGRNHSLISPALKRMPEKPFIAAEALLLEGPIDIRCVQQGYSQVKRAMNTISPS